jgi:hypothetical protein
MSLVPATLLSLALVGLVACAPAVTQQPTPTAAPAPTLPTRQVTADQVAQSMQDDQFFTDFGDSTLLVEGTLAAIEQLGGHTRLRLATSQAFDVVCDSGQQTPAVQVGQLITVKSANPRRDASRDAGSVLLANCSLA